MDSVERKVIDLQLKEDGEPGEFTARIATLGVIDADGDVTQPGAFPPTKDVLVSAYGHASWEGVLPVGKATIREEGESVIATGVFNLASAIGRDTYETVKFSGPMQEWSYGFRAVDSVPSNQDGVAVRLIRRVDPFEISPVLKGAGVATSTLDIKSTDSTYGDNASRVLASVMSLVDRSKSLADLRAKEGRVLSTSNLNRLVQLRASLVELEAELAGLLDSAAPRDNEKSDGRRIKVEYLKLMARYNGVAV